MTRMLIRIATLALLSATSSVAAPVYTLLPGSSPQSTASGTTFPNPVRVLVTDDRSGQPIGGAQVGFSYPAQLSLVTPTCDRIPGDPSPPSCMAIADGSGVATIVFKTGVVGQYAVTIAFAGPKAQLSVTPSMTPASVAILSGIAQMKPANFSYAPIEARFTRGGVPVAGMAVTFAITPTGNGAIFDNNATRYGTVTDAQGFARSLSFQVRGGVGPGEVQVQALDASGVMLNEPVKYYSVATDRVPYSPYWWGGPAQSGWGIAMPQHGYSVFPVLFTYDAQGKPTWFVIGGDWTQGIGSTYKATLQSFRGAPYYAFDTTRVAGQASAATSLQFSGDTSFSFNAPVLQDPSNGITRPITMQPYDIRAGRNTTEPASFLPELDVSDMWWGGASQSGWGMAIARTGTALFMTWFTYDSNGNPTWFVMPADSSHPDANSWTGPVYRTAGKTVLGLGPYEPSAYAATQVGTFTIRFDGETRAAFDYTVEGHSGTLNLQRFEF